MDIDTYSEAIIPRFVWDFVKRTLKSPVAQGILALMIANFIRRNKKEGDSDKEFFERFLEDNTIGNSGSMGSSKLPNADEWVDTTKDREQPSFYNKKRKILYHVKKKPVDNKGNYKYIVMKNGKKISSYDNIRDAKKSIARAINRGWREQLDDMYLENTIDKSKVKVVGKKGKWFVLYVDKSLKYGQLTLETTNDKYTAERIASFYRKNTDEIRKAISLENVNNNCYEMKEASFDIRQFVQVADKLKSLDEVTRWVRKNNLAKHGHCQSIAALYADVDGSSKVMSAPGHVAFLKDNMVYDPIKFNKVPINIEQWKVMFPNNKESTAIKLR